MSGKAETRLTGLSTSINPVLTIDTESPDGSWEKAIFEGRIVAVEHSPAPDTTSSAESDQ